MQKQVLRGLIILSAVILGIGLQSCSKEDSAKAPSHLDELTGIWNLNQEEENKDAPTYYIFEDNKFKTLDLETVNGSLQFDDSSEFIITKENGYTFEFRLSDDDYNKELKILQKEIEIEKEKLKKATVEEEITKRKEYIEELEKDLKEYILYAKRTYKMDYSITNKQVKMTIHISIEGKERTENMELTKVESLPEYKQ